MMIDMVRDSVALCCFRSRGDTLNLLRELSCGSWASVVEDDVTKKQILAEVETFFTAVTAATRYKPTDLQG
eukprot:scaffold15795_cov63-Skeletonema_menzelii.AAC.1